MPRCRGTIVLRINVYARLESPSPLLGSADDADDSEVERAARSRKERLIVLIASTGAATVDATALIRRRV